MSVVEWDDARVLLALLRAKNLQEAGAQLALDASTVSRRLSGIERSLGARLFVRTREGLRPTATVERLRPHAERMELEAVALAQAVRAAETQVSGIVRVATTEALARMLVTEGLLNLRKEHPDLVVELLSGNHPLDLGRGDADIAVRLAGLKAPALRARCVAKMGIALYAAPAYLRARGTLRSPASLHGHDAVLPTGELAKLPEAVWLAARPGLRVVFRSNSMPSLIAAAIDAQGLLPLPSGWGDSESGLERALVLDAIPTRKVWLVTHENAADRPAVGVVSRQIGSILGRIFRP